MTLLTKLRRARIGIMKSESEKFSLFQKYVQLYSSSAADSDPGHWRPMRFAEDRVIMSAWVGRVRHDFMEVCYFVSSDYWKFKRNSGALSGVISLLAEAVVRTGYMEIRFVGAPGGEGSIDAGFEFEIPVRIRDASSELGVELTGSNIISHSEGIELFKRIEEFSGKAFEGFPTSLPFNWDPPIDPHPAKPTRDNFGLAIICDPRETAEITRNKKIADENPPGSLITDANTLKQGDVITGLSKEGYWDTAKVLTVDGIPAQAVHCAWYRSTSWRPTVSTLQDLGTAFRHSPLSPAAVQGWYKVTNTPVKRSELGGFKVFLQLTDPERYHRLLEIVK